jgi:hypothetical protein
VVRTNPGDYPELGPTEAVRNTSFAVLKAVWEVPGNAAGVRLFIIW